MRLIIVESPSKAKTIEKYLKGKYKVEASAGHVRDLPEKTLSVNVKNNFEPKYAVLSDKKDVIKKLSSSVEKADAVYLATDPDREGEAISWHLKEVLKLKDGTYSRIVFNEISEKAVTNAINSPRDIDMNLVNSQQARRVLDRLVGYKLSPLLNAKIKKGLSAGRVQSVALRILVDREKEIIAFVPAEYWNITANLESKRGKPLFKALLSDYKGKKLKIDNAVDAERIYTEIVKQPFTVKSVKKQVTKAHAPAPFTTSTLQQDANSKLNMSSAAAMRTAQQLYEGIAGKDGHIAFVTYIRTDSVRISTDAQTAARKHIAAVYGSDYVPDKPNFYKAKAGAQDAHEAIRPIDLAMTPEKAKSLIDRDQYRLYKLIYERFTASQMSEAEYDQTSAEIASGDYGFKASGKTLKFAGWTKAYNIEVDEEEGKRLPELVEGDVLSLNKLEKEQKFTKPPQRYTEATLIKTMEEKGIGRPSTYASIIAVLKKRVYVEKEGKCLKPTEIAFPITEFLEQYFSDIMEVTFTAKMEDSLDEIAEGGKDWHKLIADFYAPFSEKLIAANKSDEEPTDEKCEVCGSPMVRKSGRYGKYLECVSEDCKHRVKEKQEVETTDVVCPKCGGFMIIKEGKYGKFLGCSNYPTCDQILPYSDEKSEEKCAECGGDMLIKTGRFGKYLVCSKCGAKKSMAVKVGKCPVCGADAVRKRTKSGKTFYGCSHYPECNFMSWEMPTGEKCPKCGKFLVKVRGLVKCSDANCDYKKDDKEE